MRFVTSDKKVFDKFYYKTIVFKEKHENNNHVYISCIMKHKEIVDTYFLFMGTRYVLYYRNYAGIEEGKIVMFQEPFMSNYAFGNYGYKSVNECEKYIGYTNFWL